jgi:excisionase family DNA binding protein
MEILASSVADAKKNLGLSEPTIYRLIKQGKLERVKVGRKTLITMKSQRALLGLDEAA